MYNQDGWFNKHGHVGAPEGFPQSATDRLKGVAVDQMRRRGHLPAVGAGNIKGENWRSLSTAGKLGKFAKILGPMGLSLTVAVGVYEDQSGVQIGNEVICGAVWGCGDAN